MSSQGSSSKVASSIASATQATQQRPSTPLNQQPQAQKWMKQFRKKMQGDDGAKRDFADRRKGDGDADHRQLQGRGSEGGAQMALMMGVPFPATVEGDCQEEEGMHANRD